MTRDVVGATVIRPLRLLVKYWPQLAACYLLGLLLRMVLSFSKPYSPLLPVLHRIFEPLSRPFVFLKIGRFDFSGSVLVLVLWFWLGAILPQMISRLNLWLLG